MNDTPTPRTKEIWGAMLYTYPFLINCVTETGELERELTAVTEQRDRLANALDNLVNANQKWNETMMGIIGRPPNWNDSYLNEAKEALQFLDQDHFPDVGNMIGTTTTKP